MMAIIAPGLADIHIFCNAVFVKKRWYIILAISAGIFGIRIYGKSNLAVVIGGEDGRSLPHFFINQERKQLWQQNVIGAKTVDKKLYKKK